MPIDQAITDRWGKLSGSSVARKGPLPVIDGLLAATALEHKLIFVTRDTQDLAATGVEFLDPWAT